MDEKKFAPERELTLKIGGKKVSYTREKAGRLIKKALELESMEGDINSLREFSSAFGLTLPQAVQTVARELKERHRSEVLKSCDGNERLAEEFLKLEAKATPSWDNGFSELIGYFPEMGEGLDSLPEEVIAAAEMRKTPLLDEYLRFRLKQKISASEQARQQRAIKRQSIGTQKSAEFSGFDPIKEEFLKGLWRK